MVLVIGLIGLTVEHGIMPLYKKWKRDYQIHKERKTQWENFFWQFPFDELTKMKHYMGIMKPSLPTSAYRPGRPEFYENFVSMKKHAINKKDQKLMIKSFMKVWKERKAWYKKMGVKNVAN